MKTRGQAGRFLFVEILEMTATGRRAQPGMAVPQAASGRAQPGMAVLQAERLEEEGGEERCGSNPVLVEFIRYERCEVCFPGSHRGDPWAATWGVRRRR